MDGMTSQFVLYMLGSVFAGAALGWLLRGVQGSSRVRQVSDDLQRRVDDLIRHRDRLISESANLRNTIESLQGEAHRQEVAAARGRTELESANERQKQLSRDLFTLRAEREDFKTKISEFQNALAAFKRQSAELQSEFLKSREFYKGELAKSFEKRKELESKLEEAKHEQESFANLLASSRSEHESVNKMLASAQNRMRHLDSLEDNVIRLEAENAQLNHDAVLAQQEIDVLKRDLAELEELKVQNKELAQVLKSMENSRKQYEEDAKRYREYADQSEHRSETLRLRLDEVEKNFADIEKQQRAALSDARKTSVPEKVNGDKKREVEKDDLQEIVGIGKVFEHALNELGVYTFAQIAAFDVADIARVNMALKEYNGQGRMEQDDWIGQARELHFRKYGEAEQA
jgi:predicted flap endonuclease-1-like 5' DNA nuclease